MERRGAQKWKRREYACRGPGNDVDPNRCRDQRGHNRAKEEQRPRIGTGLPRPPDGERNDQIERTNEQKSQMNENVARLVHILGKHRLKRRNEFRAIRLLELIPSSDSVLEIHLPQHLNRWNVIDTDELVTLLDSSRGGAVAHRVNDRDARNDRGAYGQLRPGTRSDQRGDREDDREQRPHRRKAPSELASALRDIGNHIQPGPLPARSASANESETSNESATQKSDPVSMRTSVPAKRASGDHRRNAGLITSLGILA